MLRFRQEERKTVGRRLPDAAGRSTPKFETQNKSIIEEQTLHARTLGFIHPVTGEKLSFTSDLPEYFDTLLTKLRKMEG